MRAKKKKKKKKKKQRKDPMREVLGAFVGCIDATGGVVVTNDSKSGLVYEPVGDRDWIDLGGVYATACHVLKRRLKVMDENGDTFGAQNQYDVRLKSGKAEATLLVAAVSEEEAVKAALDRLEKGDVCWEGKPGKKVMVVDVTDLGPDDAGEY